MSHDEDAILDLLLKFLICISVKYDDADNKKPGWKFAEYELKGVPVRLAMGGRDLENNTIEVMRRDTLEKETITCDGIEEYVKNLLEEIQANIFKKAYDHREANAREHLSTRTQRTSSPASYYQRRHISRRYPTPST